VYSVALGFSLVSHPFSPSVIRARYQPPLDLL